MTQYVESVIIGGGQAGLSTAYHLGRRSRACVVLEQDTHAAGAWRNDRWDSFTLVTPNWAFRLPGANYDGLDPDGFMPRQEIVARIEAYIERFHIPIRYHTRVRTVEPHSEGPGYLVQTDDGDWDCANVIVATGLFQRPRIPGLGGQLSPSLYQIASGQYRNPDALPPGAVLVVGSAQSGCQIAEELHLSGRRVFLCVGRAGRAPRHYRGRDIFVWLEQTGFLKRTVDQLASPGDKFNPNPHVSGARGGHSLNLHQFARDGIVLMGHLAEARDTTVRLAPDLRANLAISDQFEADLTRLIDRAIERTGVDAPREELPQLRDGYEVEPIDELDLRAAEVSTVIWATGYRFDYSLVKLAATDADGFPSQKRGVTGFPGLYFVGMPWLHTQGSGLLMGVGDDADYIADHIASRMTGS